MNDWSALHRFQQADPRDVVAASPTTTAISIHKRFPTASSRFGLSARTSEQSTAGVNPDHRRRRRRRRRGAAGGRGGGCRAE
jgi:hypothetical protein